MKIDLVAFFTWVLNNEIALYVAMVIVVLLLTQIIKLIFKHFTNKIKNENKRKKANLVIYALPFVVAFGLYAIYDLCFLKCLTHLFDFTNIVKVASTSTTLYVGLETAFKNFDKKYQEITKDGDLTATEVLEIKKSTEKDLEEIKKILNNK